MKKSLFINWSMFLITFFFCSPVLHSQDWPQWRGIDRTGSVEGFKAPKAWPAELSQIWKINVGSGDASPVIAGREIYLFTRQGDNEILRCLDAGSGKEIWKSSYPADLPTGPSSSHPGPRSTPTLAEGKIITLGVSGILSCFDAATGKLIWRRDNPSKAVPVFFTGMSPVVTGKICIAHLGNKDKGEVIAFDLATGKEKWKLDSDGPAYGSPVLITASGVKQVIIPTDKSLIGVNIADGKLLWQVATPPNQRYYNSVSPCIDGQTIIYTGQGTGLKAFSIGKQGDQFTIKEKWSNPETGTKWNTPVINGRMIYGIADSRKIFCMNAETGQTVWIANTMHNDFGSVVNCGSVIFALPSTANLIAFKPGTGEYSEIARYKVSDTPVFAHPVISGDKIYIKDAENLILYSLK